MTLVSHFFTRLALFSASIAVLVPCVAADVSVLESCPQYQHPVNLADIIGMVRDVESGELHYCDYPIIYTYTDPQSENKQINV